MSPLREGDDGGQPPRRNAGLVALTLGAFAVGAALVLLFESVLPRVIGALVLCGFIVAGVFLLADPRFLEADDD